MFLETIKNGDVDVDVLRNTIESSSIDLNKQTADNIALSAYSTSIYKDSYVLADL